MMLSNTKLFFNSLKKLNLCIQKAENTPVSIILAFNHFDIIHNGACVPTNTCKQDSCLPDLVDCYCSGIQYSCMKDPDENISPFGAKIHETLA